MKLVSKWLALPLIALLIITGCSSIGGLNIQKAIQANLKTESSESKQTIKFELEPASDQISKKDKEMIALINTIEFNIDSAKVQSAKEMSIKGDISYSGKKLPLQLSMDEKGMTLLIEGAKKPFYYSLQNSNMANMDFQKYEEQVNVLTSKLYDIILKHTPDLKNISIKSVQENINGQSTSLTQLHFELNGEEIVSLIKPFLTSLVKDEAGLKELIGIFYDLFTDIYDVDSSTTMPNLEDKETTVMMAYGMIQPALTKFLESYDEQLDNVYKQAPQLKTVLGKDTVLKTDLYFDSSLKIRKQHVELKVMLPEVDQLPIKSFKMISEAEVWNIAGDVKAEKVDVSGGVLEFNYGPEDYMTPGKILGNFEPSSDVYNLLKNELKITKQTFLIDSGSDYFNIINKQDTAFIPLRHITDRLDAKVKWTKGSKVVTIIDDITQNEIVLTIGSKEAVVAGKTVELAAPVFEKESSSLTYVPLRFITEALGGSLYMDSEGLITITRD